MYYKAQPLIVTDIDTKKGIITGKFSDYLNVDSGGELSTKGQFKSTLENPARKSRVKVMVGHNSNQGLGIPTWIKEENDGAYYECTVIPTSKNLDYLLLAAGGYLSEHSYGYEEAKSKMVKGVKHLLDTPLWEISLLEWGMSEHTPLIGIKSLDQISPFIKQLDDFSAMVHKSEFSSDEVPQEVERQLLKTKAYIEKLENDIKARAGINKEDSDARANAGRSKANGTERIVIRTETELLKERLKPQRKAALSFQPQNLGVLSYVLPEPVNQMILEIAASVDSSDLHAHGAIDGSTPAMSPHLTLLYGLHEIDLEDLAEHIGATQALEFDIYGLDVFKGDDFDVLYARCSGDDLYHFHNSVRNTFTNTSTHGYYSPHITIAYLEKGTGIKYAYDEANWGLVDVRNLSVDVVTYSDKNEVTKTFEMLPSAPAVSIDMIDFANIEDILWSLLWTVDDILWSKSFAPIAFYAKQQSLTAKQVKSLRSEIVKGGKAANELLTPELQETVDAALKALDQLVIKSEPVKKVVDTSFADALKTLTEDYDFSGASAPSNLTDRILKIAEDYDFSAQGITSSAGTSLDHAFSEVDELQNEALAVVDGSSSKEVASVLASIRGIGTTSAVSKAIQNIGE